MLRLGGVAGGAELGELGFAAVADCDVVLVEAGGRRLLVDELVDADDDLAVRLDVALDAVGALLDLCAWKPCSMAASAPPMSSMRRCSPRPRARPGR